LKTVKLLQFAIKISCLVKPAVAAFHYHIHAICKIEIIGGWLEAPQYRGISCCWPGRIMMRRGSIRVINAFMAGNASGRPCKIAAADILFPLSAYTTGKNGNADHDQQ